MVGVRRSAPYTGTIRALIADLSPGHCRVTLRDRRSVRNHLDSVHAVGGVVYHDVTELKWALKGLESGVDGLIAVNRQAGGHAGARTVQALFDEVCDLGLPMVCAGGVGSPRRFAEALQIGYAGVQCGTRFIATWSATRRTPTSKRSLKPEKTTSCSANGSPAYR